MGMPVLIKHYYSCNCCWGAEIGVVGDIGTDLALCWGKKFSSLGVWNRSNKFILKSMYFRLVPMERFQVL